MNRTAAPAGRVRLDLLDPLEVSRLRGLEVVTEGVVEGFLTGLIHGTESTGFQTVQGALTQFQRMARDDRHKLIVYPKVKRIQLFDIAADPWETRDLSDDPKNRALVLDLWARMNRIQRELHDPMVVPVFV